MKKSRSELRAKRRISLIKDSLKECVQCGGLFIPKTRVHKFCAPRCSKIYRKEHYKDFVAKYYPQRVKPIKRICPKCKKEFFAKGKRTYCFDHDRPQVWSPSKFTVFNRDNFTCQYCGRNPTEDGVKLVLDHITPRNAQGPEALENYVTACQECNQLKGKQHLSHEKEFKERILWRAIQLEFEKKVVSHK